MISNLYLNLRRLCLFLAFALIISPLWSQEDAVEPVWESFYITPDNTQLKALSEALSKHNKKYHAEGAHMARVYNVVSGPNIGKLIWQMGPLRFSDLDTRPSKGGHDEDWRDNVMPYVKKMSHGEYWKQDNRFNNTEMLDGDVSKTPILHIRFHEVARGHGYNLDGLLEQITKTVKAMDGDNPWGVYDNQFRQGYTIGRHLATVSFLKNWAEYDDDNNFKKTFMEIHGENSWESFIRGMDDALTNSWDEIWQYNAELSGN